MRLQPNYIVDNDNNKVAVQLDINTYEKITDALENYALFKFIEENQNDEKLSLQEAKEFYKTLNKTNGS